MTDTRQELVARGHFAGQRQRNLRFIREMLDAMAAGKIRDLQSTYSDLLHRSFMNGCIALILEEGDEEARNIFTDSVVYALKLIGVPGVRGGGVRIYEANVQLSEHGSQLTSLNEKVPGAGTEKLSITDYHRALICVGCFGAPSQLVLIASVPEESYRNPDVVASADHWALVRAWKWLLFGKDAEARREAQFVVAKGSGSGKSEAAAMLALLDGDRNRFDRSLQEAVKLYVKATSKQQNDPLTSVFFPGLMLCRMALDRGFAVAERPYLPVHLLPSHGSQPKSEAR